MKKRDHQQGIVKAIIVIVIALLVLSYYGFDLRRTVEAPTTRSNFSYVSSAISSVWNNYLERPAKFIWNDVFIRYIIHSSTSTKP